MSTFEIGAFVLAGGNCDANLKRMTGETKRALVPLNGKPMVDYVIDALQKSETVRRVVVVGDVPSRDDCIHVPEGESLLDNVMRGLSALSTKEAGYDQEISFALCVTADIPFVTPAAIDDFVYSSMEMEATLAYPIIDMNDYGKRFKSMKRTTLKTREGEFTGGNIMLLRSDQILIRRDAIEKAYLARKNVTKMAALLGPQVVLRLLLSKLVSQNFLTLPILEDAVARVLGQGCSAKAVLTKYAELGTDVDSPADVSAAEKLLISGSV